MWRTLSRGLVSPVLGGSGGGTMGGTASSAIVALDGVDGLVVGAGASSSSSS